MRRHGPWRAGVRASTRSLVVTPGVSRRRASWAAPGSGPARRNDLAAGWGCCTWPAWAHCRGSGGRPVQQARDARRPAPPPRADYHGAARRRPSWTPAATT
ncbi:MAG: hypothetical protein WKG07_30625 [Hymenobacter sp.]